MYNNQDFPWYLQQVPEFVSLYNSFYDIATNITPLPIGEMFDLEQLQGTALFLLGQAWGLTGSPTYYDGLIYNVDNWSEDKVWSGQPQSINNQIYRNFVRMKAFIYGRNYSLELVRDALAILLDGFQYTASVTENYMAFTINITAPSAILRILQEMRSYDDTFLGQLPGIHYDFAYTATDEQIETNEVTE